MFVLVDLAASHPTVALEAPDDCTRFHVRVTGPHDPAKLAPALADAAVGRLDGDDAFIRIAAVEAMAAGHVGDEWRSKFDGMLEYARMKGWLDDSGDAIQAHVEWYATQRSEAPPGAAHSSGSVSDP